MVVKELENPRQRRSRARVGLPLYWPKFTVRSLLVVLILLLFLTSYPTVLETIASHDTFTNLLITIVSFVLGLAGRQIGKSFISWRVRKLAKRKGISLSDAGEEIDPSMKKNSLIMESILSIIVITAVLSSLFMFTFNLDPTIPLFGIVAISVRENLLQLINLYFGFRQ